MTYGKMLNHRSFAILQWIIDFKVDNNGNSPTTGEITDGLGLSSKSVVHYHLEQLEKAGLIERSRTSGSGIRHASRIAVPGIEVYWSGPSDLLELGLEKESY